MLGWVINILDFKKQAWQVAATDHVIWLSQCAPKIWSKTFCRPNTISCDKIGMHHIGQISHPGICCNKSQLVAPFYYVPDLSFSNPNNLMKIWVFFLSGFDFPHFIFLYFAPKCYFASFCPGFVLQVVSKFQSFMITLFWVKLSSMS